MISNMQLFFALTAASGATDQVLGNPLEDAASLSFSIYKLGSDKKDMKKVISTLMAKQNFFAEAMKTVQTAKERKIALSG